METVCLSVGRSVRPSTHLELLLVESPLQVHGDAVVLRLRPLELVPLFDHVRERVIVTLLVLDEVALLLLLPSAPTLGLPL